MTDLKKYFTKQNVIRIVILILFLALFAVILVRANSGWNGYTTTDSTGIEYETAKVTAVLEDNTVKDESVDGFSVGSRTLQIKLLTGRYAGDSVEVTNYLSAMYNVDVGEGDTVVVRIDTTGENEYQVSVYNYNRMPQTIGCVAAFILLLILIGGKKGAKSVLGLIFTMVCIIWVLLPLSLKGFSPLLVTIILILICNFVSFFLIDGIQLKTIIAAAGSICGVLAGAFFALAAQQMMSITTYQMDEAEALLLITSTTKLQMKDLFLCGILIACMGAVMDVAMSIASSVSELHQVNPKLGRWELFRSGMNIGRDAMGTMSNTLILAFTGNSFNMMLMIYSYGVSFQQLINTDFVSIEVVRSIAGSIGIICTVPIVAFIAAMVYGKEAKRCYCSLVNQ